MIRRLLIAGVIFCGSQTAFCMQKAASPKVAAAKPAGLTAEELTLFLNLVKAKSELGDAVCERTVAKYGFDTITMYIMPKQPDVTTSIRDLLADRKREVSLVEMIAADFCRQVANTTPDNDDATAEPTPNEVWRAREKMKGHAPERDGIFELELDPTSEEQSLVAS